MGTKNICGQKERKDTDLIVNQLGNKGHGAHHYDNFMNQQIVLKP